MKLFGVLFLLFTFSVNVSLNAQTEVHSLLPMEFKVLAEKTKGVTRLYASCSRRDLKMCMV